MSEGVNTSGDFGDIRAKQNIENICYSSRVKSSANLNLINNRKAKKFLSRAPKHVVNGGLNRGSCIGGKKQLRGTKKRK